MPRHAGHVTRHRSLEGLAEEARRRKRVQDWATRQVMVRALEPVKLSDITL